MVSIIVDDIIPILILMILGYICGKLDFFDSDQLQGLNKLVLDIALPAALFISIVKATRSMFVKDIRLTIVSVVGVVGLFMVSYYLDKLLFHRSTQQAAVCALIAGSPTIGFLGFAVLDPIYGNDVTTNLVIGIVSIVVNAITIPLGLFLINKGLAQDKEAATSDNTSDSDDKDDKKKKSKGNSHIMESIISAIKKPVAAAPLLAVLFVLTGLRIPNSWDPTFDLIAKANAGVAVLAAGVALSTVKFAVNKEVIWNTFFRLFLTPAIIVAFAYIIGMGFEPHKISMLALATGLPPAFSGIIISSRFKIYVKEGASTVAVSTVVFAVSCIFWIWILPLIAGWIH
ncbi:AEC family transporter [Lactobacillus rodentium]|uniref:Putative transporter YfdV n=1 Tax=Lactobacillus rodentium TaxID=947835 RepID=A0A2Z6TQP8_9LACO|nr:AEC family transporter [Lactobacillus rodentium]MCR1894836.1 AEC family transporter [Lactobacillus rodentium]GBG05137.1 putative transporter YfdV [Lactobacillus rodentium]